MGKEERGIPIEIAGPGAKDAMSIRRSILTTAARKEGRAPSVAKTTNVVKTVCVSAAGRVFARQADNNRARVVIPFIAAKPSCGTDR